MQKGDNLLPNIILAGHVLLVKMLTEQLLNRTVYFDQMHTYTKGKSNEERKDLKSIQSNTTPDPGHHMRKFPILCPRSGVLFGNVTKPSHTREPRGQTFLNR